MSDEGEKTCPLCAEEMDLTDQQLKPCKCGYEICVWCWHHIMDMAEKDNTEGRCPACRTPYNKEKIVGTTSNCERLVTGMSVEKKQKPQKGKTKTSEGRKQLASVRVIQRNLVYIVGLPLNLADEDLMQQKEYFGQYGKVLKVSISRTAAGAIQQYPNSTCSVYITYSKEEEAVRSIQATHGFILEGKPLRACFGTTKYCHAWLRNVPCTNADCLYLHEFGPQEDSFTKDEIISAYTRNRVQQITGATNDMQRRSGNLLPPPADDYNNSNSSWTKSNSKSTTNNPENIGKVSPPNSSSGRSGALPATASWGARASHSQPSMPQADTSAVVSPLLNRDEIVKKHYKENHTFQEKSNLAHASSAPSSSLLSSTSPKKDKNISGNVVLDLSSSSVFTRHYSIDKNQREQPCEAEQFIETLASNEAEPSELVLDLQKKVAQVAINEAEEDLPSFDDQRLRDTEVVTHTSYIQNPPCISPQHASVDQNFEKDPQHAFNLPVVNGYFHGTEEGRSQVEIFEAKGDHSTAIDIGESSIISNILSMDFDPWDESLTSPRNLAKFLGGSESHRVLSSRKAQNSNQSRFSFARQDERIDQGSNGLEYKNFSPGFVSNNSIYLDDKRSYGNDFSSFSYEESDKFARNYSHMSENRISVSKAQVSAPPGFSGPSKAPPPGFLSGNHMLDTYALMRKPHQAAAPVNIGGVGDIEFMDPAILAVGGRVPSGLRSSFPAQLNSFENDVRLQLLMQNPKFTELGDSYPPQIDSYGINLSPYQRNGFQQPMMSNGHWNGWNEVEGGNDIPMAEMLRNERPGFNRYYSGHETSYNRTFGI